MSEPILTEKQAEDAIVLFGHLTMENMRLSKDQKLGHDLAIMLCDYAIYKASLPNAFTAISLINAYLWDFGNFPKDDPALLASHEERKAISELRIRHVGDGYNSLMLAVEEQTEEKSDPENISHLFGMFYRNSKQLDEKMLHGYKSALLTIDCYLADESSVNSAALAVLTRARALAVQDEDIIKAAMSKDQPSISEEELVTAYQRSLGYFLHMSDA